MPDEIRSQLLKESVICTTGPSAVVHGLFRQLLQPKQAIDEYVALYSFDLYKLDRAFKSENPIPLHTPPRY